MEHALVLMEAVLGGMHPAVADCLSARRLFVSPDGQLAMVPFAALHDGKSFLVDTFDFAYLTSGKDLLPRLQQPVPPAERLQRVPSAPSPSRASSPAEATSSKGRASTGCAARSWWREPRRW
uniref:CHAT domain-containing protein n=1 Tax=Pyxidicoccus xibeiensis TaxID=2906759 RepID=UPI002B20FB13|nr:CHAT domain-containing protein [Pyxidicoccus xibeiensis]